MDRREEVAIGRKALERAGSSVRLSLINAQWDHRPLSSEECLNLMDIYGLKVREVIIFLDLFGLDYDEEGFVDALIFRDESPKSIMCVQ